MTYYMNRTIDGSFDELLARVIEELKIEGFGVLTDIDVQATLKEKLGIEFRKYRILGACNPPFAHRALLAEDKVGVLLPCNVVLQELQPGKVEVAAMDPAAAMESIDNAALQEVADLVRDKLQRVLERL